MNIVEANHVAFLDRWYNPFVHDQAEDRAHRYGQQKDVHVTYFDCAGTIDEAMVEINEVKKANSVTILMDDFDVGNGSTRGLSYKELSGILSTLIRDIRSLRNALISANPGSKDEPIPSFDPEKLRSLVANHKAKEQSPIPKNQVGKTEVEHAELGLRELVDTGK